MDKFPVIGAEQVLYVSAAAPPLTLIPAMVEACDSSTGVATLKLLDGTNRTLTLVPYSRALASGSWPLGSWHYRGGF
jgi:hypothetical protein